VILSAASPNSQLNNQFCKCRIYAYSGVSRARTFRGGEPNERIGLGENERIISHKTALADSLPSPLRWQAFGHRSPHAL